MYRMEKAKEKGESLSYNEQMDLFKELANVVGPSMYVGTKGARSGSEDW